MTALFAPFSTALQNVGLALVAVGVGAAVLAIAVLALMNMWAIFDPRMGQAVKGNLMRVILSLVMLGGASGFAGVAAILVKGGA